MEIQLSLRSYDHSRRVGEQTLGLPLETGGSADLGGDCRVRLRTWKSQDVVWGEADFSFHRPTALASSVAVEVEVPNWKTDTYVFFPGAVYDGNRFSCQKLAYPSYAQVPSEAALEASPVITDIPRLGEDSQRIQLRSGDMTTPAAGYFDREENRGFLLLTTHLAHGEYTGLEIQEDGAKGRAKLAVSVPALREERKYFFGELPDGRGFYPTSDYPSDDTGRWFAAGEQVRLPFCLWEFPAQSIPEFFEKFNQFRTSLEQGQLPEAVPLGKAYQTVKEKFQRENFLESGPDRFYTVGTCREVPQQIWQAGWVGGGMNGYPFLLEDEGQPRQRALDTFRFIFDRLQLENGWVCGMYGNGVFYGDTFDLSKPSDVLLIRKDGDLLYFTLKQFLACREALKDYEQNLRALCDAFVRLYRKYGQIGQFIHTQTDTMAIGNSGCGAIVCAALALAYEIFRQEDYLETARGLGELYEKDYLLRGVVNGCPGEICQAPDSEGAFALLEGYVQLYETTGEARWLQCAKQGAELAMTWVMSYDFAFPQDSAAAKRGAHTLGTVFANAQNKHSAPGICTLSGNSLLKLYRFTGEEKYLTWLQTITRALPQFVSLPERPVMTLEGKYLPAGYVNERVQTSDWEGKHTIGQFLYGSNWPEVSLMLTYVEVPGLYADLSSGRVTAFDSVRWGILEKDGGEALHLWVENPTPYDTVLTLLADEPTQRLTHNYFAGMERLELKAGQRREIWLRRRKGEENP